MQCLSNMCLLAAKLKSSNYREFCEQTCQDCSFDGEKLGHSVSSFRPAGQLLRFQRLSLKSGSWR